MWATWYDLGLKRVTVATELRKITETKEGQLGGKWNNQARDGGSWDPGGRRGKVAGSSWIRDPFGREDRVCWWSDREAGERRFVGGVYFQGKVRSSVLYLLSFCDYLIPNWGHQVAIRQTAGHTCLAFREEAQPAVKAVVFVIKTYLKPRDLMRSSRECV